MWRKKNVHVMHFMYTGNTKSWQNTQFVHLTEVIIFTLVSHGTCVYMAYLPSCTVMIWLWACVAPWGFSLMSLLWQACNITPEFSLFPLFIWQELKDVHHKDQMAAARGVLQRNVPMLYTASRACLQHPDVAAYKANRDLIYKQLQNAVSGISNAAQATSSEDSSFPQSAGGGELAYALNNFDVSSWAFGCDVFGPVSLIQTEIASL